MDVAAPYEMFNWMAVNWRTTRQVQVFLVAENNGSVTTRDGLQLVPHKTFKQVPKLDVLWVPGADPDALAKQMKNRIYLDFLRTRSKYAAWVTSVCEGALLLASAGLLDGYLATTHWAFIPCLRRFPRIKVADGYPRFVVDRNRVTGGGISSGMDEALELIKHIVGKGGEKVAEQVQVVTQYFPKPPVNGKIPGAVTCPVQF